MAEQEGLEPTTSTGLKKPSEEFSAYCEAEIERRLNSDEEFDEAAYRKATALVVERLVRLEEEGRK
jgi:hypothetical protein